MPCSCVRWRNGVLGVALLSVAVRCGSLPGGGIAVPQGGSGEPRAAEAAKSSGSNKLPGAPAADDESPVGDTDQQSDA